MNDLTFYIVLIALFVGVILFSIGIFKAFTISINRHKKKAHFIKVYRNVIDKIDFDNKAYRPIKIPASHREVVVSSSELHCILEDQFS